MRLLDQQNTIHGIAKPVSLRATPGLALVGEDGQMEPVYGLIRSIICQATVFHSPSDLKVMIVTDNVDPVGLGEMASALPAFDAAGHRGYAADGVDVGGGFQRGGRRRAARA